MTQAQYSEEIIPEIGLSAKSTVSSLNYAKLVQDAILCDRKGIYELFNEYSLVYKPKNILSGDFYFYVKRYEKVYLAVCDCTGHGISGAMLSILGHNMLLRSLKKFEKTDEILTYLNRKIKASFNEFSKLSNTGMDITLVCIDEKNSTIEFSGAHQSLIHATNGQVFRYRGDRDSIGSIDKKNWSRDVIKYEKGDKLFFTSDGLPDQFGDLSGKKYSYRRMLKFIKDNLELSQKDLEVKITEDLLEHQGDEVQTDDILFLGITL